MKAGRFVALVAVMAVAAGGAYFFWPEQFNKLSGGLVGQQQAAEPAKKADGKARAPAAPVTVASVLATSMPVILVAPGAVEPLANVGLKSRVDGQII
jgi:multidrug efflux pump subunit AcrA (membrane-fusion protein)